MEIASFIISAISILGTLVLGVYTVISKNKTVTAHEITEVTFKKLTDKQIIDYVNTGSPLDKAGAYGIQDGDFLVDTIVGDYDNVVGLPVLKIKKLLAELVWNLKLR